MTDSTGPDPVLQQLVDALHRVTASWRGEAKRLRKDLHPDDRSTRATRIRSRAEHYDTCAYQVEGPLSAAERLMNEEKST